MGSLRNPIGPLPSSIYWRRRAVALALVALFVLLAAWVFSMGGGGAGGDDKNNAGGESGGSGPTKRITPGPTPSATESLITEKPGGRDEVGGGTGTGGGSGGGGAAAGGGTGGGGAGGAIAGSSGGLTGGDGTPADKGTPVCEPGEVTVSLRPTEETFEPGDTPTFELTVTNEGDSDCRVDLGRKATVVTVTDADDKPVWSSTDCPPGGASAYVLVPAGGKTSHTLEWERVRTTPKCESGSDSGERVPAGSYRIEAKIKGLKAQQASFTLAKG